MTDAIRERHRPNPTRVETYRVCVTDSQPWPCDTEQMARERDAVLANRDDADTAYWLCYSERERLQERADKAEAALATAIREFDNIRWEDVFAATGRIDPELARWTRKYVGYARAALAAHDEARNGGIKNP
jgi:hypothetical protein